MVEYRGFVGGAKNRPGSLQDQIRCEGIVIDFFLDGDLNVAVDSLTNVKCFPGPALIAQPVREHGLHTFVDFWIYVLGLGRSYGQLVIELLCLCVACQDQCEKTNNKTKNHRWSGLIM